MVDPPNILITNVKTRRLGYLRPVMELCEEYLLPRGIFINRLEEWAQKNRVYLIKYVNQSGEITKTIKHNAALRYLNFAKNLDLITKSGEMYGITKYGKVMIKLPKLKQNPFELNLFEICPLLRRLLLKDSDGLIPLFELLIEGEKKQAGILRRYKKILLNRFISKEKKCRDLLEKMPFRGKIDEIRRWTNEKKYLENIVPPRLNWLIDLKIIDWQTHFKNSVYKLNNSGSAIFSGFFSSNGIIDIDKEWCENEYYSVFYDAYKEKLPEKKKFRKLTLDKREKIINSYLRESFPIFKSKGAPRMTLSTFIEYVCTKLLVTDGIICGFKDIKSELERISIFGKFQYRWIPSTDDGFLILT